MRKRPDVECVRVLRAMATSTVAREAKYSDTLLKAVEFMEYYQSGFPTNLQVEIMDQRNGAMFDRKTVFLSMWHDEGLMAFAKFTKSEALELADKIKQLAEQAE